MKHFQHNLKLLLLAMALTVGFALVTEFVSEPGRWYSDYLALRQVTDAFFQGSLAIGDSPVAMDGDRVWMGDIYHVWGLGVPLFRFVFEAVAALAGREGFPDRITFLIAWMLTCFLTLTVLIRLETRSVQGESIENTGFIRIATTLVVIMFTPPLVTLARTRFEVYEEVVAYGCLYGICVFMLLLNFALRPDRWKLILLAGFCGFSVFIRPTLLFYAAFAMGSALLLGWRARFRFRYLAGAASLFCALGALQYQLNHYRFGDGFDFGHKTNLASQSDNVFALKFDYPFRQEPLIPAVKDLFGSTFLSHELNGHDYFRADFFPGQSPTYRWHEFYFTTFDPLYLFVLFVVIGAWLYEQKPRFRKHFPNAGTTGESSDQARDPSSIFLNLAAPWALLSMICLALLYLRSPSLSSRYTLDFLPAVAILFGAGTWSAFGYIRRHHAKRSTALSIALYLLITGWVVYEIASAEISPAHAKRRSLTWEEVEQRLARKEINQPVMMPKSYHMGTNAVSNLPFNCQGWNRKSGDVQSTTIIFVENPNRLVLELFPLEGKALHENDLMPIQAKIGAEHLARQSVSVDGNSATVVFDAPKRERFRTGIQACIIGFIDPMKLGISKPQFRLRRIEYQ